MNDATMGEEETLLVINRLHQVLRPFLLRREKREVQNQLPEKVEKVMRCNVSALQRHQLDFAEQNVLISIEKDPKHRKQSVANPIMAMRKICNHPFLTMTTELWTENFTADDLIRTSGKFEMLHRMLPKLTKTGHRVLLFSQMTQLLDVMEQYLNHFGYENKYLRLDGNVKAEIRGDLMARFNAPDSPHVIFLLSTRAGGLGLNL
jgi:ATP-dependent helicase STH1/SNF2